MAPRVLHIGGSLSYRLAYSLCHVNQGAPLLPALQTSSIIPRAARFAYAAKRGLCWCG